ncbi:MAG: magnesium transporter, partial [Arenibacter algicola]|nr:magnesium transporter [Arenibacter algicola]
MTDPELDKNDRTDPAAAPVPNREPDPNTDGGDADSLTDTVVDGVIAALDAGDDQRVRELVAPLHFSEQADLAEVLSGDQRRAMLTIVQDILEPEFFSELDESLRDEVWAVVGFDTVAEAVSELDTDDAVDIIEDLEHHE